MHTPRRKGNAKMKIEVSNVTSARESTLYYAIENESMGFHVSYSYEGYDTFRLLLVEFDATNDCHRENLSRMLLDIFNAGMIVQKIS